MVLSLVCVAGLAFGILKVHGVGLGRSGVLFAGIVVGQFGKPVNHEPREFGKEFGFIPRPPRFIRPRLRQRHPLPMAKRVGKIANNAASSRP